MDENTAEEEYNVEEPTHSLPESAEDIKLNASNNSSSLNVKALLSKRNVLIGGVASVVLLLIVIISVSIPKSQAPPESERLLATKSFLSLVTDTSAFKNANSPQYKAAAWLADTDVTTDIPTEPNDGVLFVQRYALTVLYYALGGPDWVFDAHFLNKDDTCQWLQRFTTQDGQFDMGVMCTGANHVKELRLPGNNLVGSIPPEIGLLTHLHHLSLFGNGITGNLPTQMEALTSLRFLSLGSNYLSGSLPNWIGKFQDLKYLELGGNSLTGMLPPDMVKMTSLLELALDSNTFVGKLQTVLNKVPNLKRIFMAENLFEDSLDDYFLADLNLKELDLSDNNLKGTLPAHFFQLPALKTLDLSMNTLTGELPTFPDTVDSLQYLSLRNNELRGEIGEEIWNLEGLRHLDLSDNEFTGKMPGYAIAWMYNITYLFLANNNFDQGDIPLLYDMTSLREISLKNTNRVGTIPHWIGHNLTQLVLLDLDNNALTGTIPHSLGDLENLNFLLLNRNELTGGVPRGFKNIAMLLLHDNKLTGDTELLCGDNKPESLEVFTTQCGGPDPPIDCSCCTTCCEDGQNDCVRGDLLATFDLSYENYYQRTQYVFSEDLIFRVQAPGEET
jgi:Leucine-rich repeat (LRR) protein